MLPLKVNDETHYRSGSEPMARQLMPLPRTGPLDLSVALILFVALGVHGPGYYLADRPVFAD